VPAKVSGTAPPVPWQDDLSTAQAAWEHSLSGLKQQHAQQAHQGRSQLKAHTVVKGESLLGIAREHRMSRPQIYRANPQFDPQREDGIPHRDRGPEGGWDPDFLLPGDRIHVTRPQRSPTHPSHSHKHKTPAKGPSSHAPLPRRRPPGLGLSAPQTGPSSGAAGRPTDQSAVPPVLPPLSPTPPGPVAPPSPYNPFLAAIVPAKVAVAIGPETKITDDAANNPQSETRLNFTLKGGWRVHGPGLVVLLATLRLIWPAADQGAGRAVSAPKKAIEGPIPS
jgi:hypothetical protein